MSTTETPTPTPAAPTNEGAPKPKPPVTPATPTSDETHGFPENTPLTDMTVEQREAYWKHKARKWEKNASSREDYEEVKRERDALKAQTMTDAEKAIEQAKKDATAETAQKYGSKMAETVMRVALGVRGIQGDELEDKLSYVDFTKFLGDNGDVDTDKVHRYLDTVAPENSSQQSWPDMGQGNRDNARNRRAGGSVDAGRAAYRARHKTNEDQNRSGVGNA